jgi:hypothetical protein
MDGLRQGHRKGLDDLGCKLADVVCDQSAMNLEEQYNHYRTLDEDLEAESSLQQVGFGPRRSAPRRPALLLPLGSLQSSKLAVRQI